MSEIAQRSPEWFALRAGKVTASRLAEVIAKTKTGWGASRANYMAELIAERLTGIVASGYTNDAMRWGTDTEPQARAAYEFSHDEVVTQIDFVGHPAIAMSGCSPDGLVGDDGLVEIKCPNTATHLDALLGGKIAEKYVVQMMWQMACTGRKWCDFVSYDPRLPMHMQLFASRVPRDGALIESLEKDVRAFLSELDGKLADLSRRYGRAA